MQYGAPHCPNNDYSANQLQTFKYGHTLSLNSHNEQVLDVLRPRSAYVLPNRGPSYPALPPDTSSDMTKETITRKLAHSTLMKANNGMGVFRRDAKPESTSDYFYQKHIVRHFLHDIHQSPKKNKSRRPQTTSVIDNSKGLKDFLEPNSPTESRKSTGYNKGHIRTMLKLDTYGPAHADSVREERSQGSLPTSPNTDRFATTSPPRGRHAGDTLTGTSPGSPDSTRTRSSIGNRSKMSKGSRTNKRPTTTGSGTGNGSRPSTNQSDASIGNRSRNKMDRMTGNPYRAETLKDSYGEYVDEINPRARGRLWYHNHRNGKVEKINNKNTIVLENQYREKMRQEAMSVSGNLDEFETRLKSIKRY
jgi:hypothetical protein